MSRKKSVKRCAQQFQEDTGVLLQFCANAERVLTDGEVSLAYDAAVIKLYAAFERMILGALVGAINNDTNVLSANTLIRFPKHLTDEVCEYIITGKGYFDFKGRDGLIKKVGQYVPNSHYLVRVVKAKPYADSLNQLCALRNFAAHESQASKRAALKSIKQLKIKSAGSWLNKQDRLRDMACDLSELAEAIKCDAPY